MEEEGADYRHWDELLPDALGLIFCKLSLQELLTVVPRVCKSWRKVVMGPYCWQEIDIEDWSKGSVPDNIDQMVRMLIPKSCGSLRKLCVSELRGDPIMSFIAEHAGSLEKLRLPRSDMSDEIMEQIAGKLSAITFLDLSYCSKIGARALGAIGKHCTQLTGLRRNMHPYDTDTKISQDDEAHAIANTMPKLKQLEIAYLLAETEGILEIISSCLELELLDVRGCWGVTIDYKFLRNKFPKLKILGPHVDYWNHQSHWECMLSDCSNSFYDSDSFDEMLSDYEGDERLELRFYDGFDEDSGYGWPPSP